MAISNLQQARQNYGLGSFVKKVTKKITKPFTKVARKIVPKEIAGIMRVAAPFLPPGYREAAYLMGTAKQTGRISPMDLALAAAPTFFDKTTMGRNIKSSVGSFTLPGMEKSLGEFAVGSPNSKGIFGSDGKMFNFGKGQGFASFRDQTKLGSLLLGDGEGAFDKSKLAGIGIGALSLIQNAKTPDDAGNDLVDATGNSEDYERGYNLFSQLDKPGLFDVPDQFRLPAMSGGLMRTNYAMGSEDMGVVNPFQPKPTGPTLPEEDKPYRPKPNPSKIAGIPEDLDLEKAVRDFIEFNGREPRDMQELLEFFNVKQQAAGGGLMRSNYAIGDMAMNQDQSMGMGISPNLGSLARIVTGKH